MAYGSPNSLDEVEAYHTQIRHGRRPSAEEVKNLIERYIAIGGRSPLLEITERQAKALEKKLNGDGIHAKVYVGMRHWHPFIAEAIQEIHSDGVRNLVAVPLAPYYSALSIGGYQKALEKAINEIGGSVNLEFIKSWHLNPWLLMTWKMLIEDGLSKFTTGDEFFVLFTAHSLPEKQGDPYQLQLLETSTELAKMLSIGEWGIAFQSASQTGERWLGPDILEKLHEVAKHGTKNILVAPVGFVSDNLEILYDIDVEAQGHARKIGLTLLRTELPNDSSPFLEALASVVKQALAKS